MPIKTANLTEQLNEEINMTNATELLNESINITTINETKAISIILAYKAGTVYDGNDNGEESINNVVDLSVEGTGLRQDFDASKLCARWDVYNIEDGLSTTFCNGNNDCCAFVDLLPSKSNWDDIYYAAFGKDGAGHSNIMSAQVLYYNVNLSSENPKSEIYFSEWGNLSVKFFDEETEFSDVCIETCFLIGLNKSSYRLLFEIEDGTVLRIDKIKYALKENIRNNAPVFLKNLSDISMADRRYTINLSEYFYDEDGNALHYSYHPLDNLSIAINGDIATLTADKDFKIGYTFFIASDSEATALSNLFKIEFSGLKENKLVFNFNDGEEINISYYAEVDGEKLKVKYKDYVKDNRKFGFVFDESEVENEVKEKKNAKRLLGAQSIGNITGISAAEKRIFYEIESSAEYGTSNFNQYMLERNLTGQFKKVRNQIGQLEDRQLKRFIDFSDIFSKNANGSMNFIKKNKGWIIEFFNMFDLDPIFIDDTDTNWDSGTKVRMVTQTSLQAEEM